MKKLLLILLLLPIVSVFADEYTIDLAKSNPECGNYKINASSTRKKVLKYCTINDTHSWRVRIFRGSEKLDIATTNMGNITCKFNRSLVNTDGALKECWSSIPPEEKAAVVTVKSQASGAQ